MKSALMIAILCTTACAFPGFDTGGSTLGGGMLMPGDTSSVAPSTLVLEAYQATGTIDGKPATISRGTVSVGATQGELVTSGDCYGIRLAQGQRLEAAEDAGTIHIDGANAPYTCSFANGAYSCDLPSDSTFFSPGATLGVTLDGTSARPGESFSGAVPPRAPVPNVALEQIFNETAPVTITWNPSTEPTEMTCLNLESLDESGATTGFVQCDVDDSQGQTTVPVEMVRMLNPDSPRLRATLYSANATGTIDAMATFGSGRFVEVHR